MADDTPAPTQPQVDPSFIQESIRKGFSEGFQQIRADQQATNQRAEQARREAAQLAAKGSDPLADVIMPYITPAVNQMNTAAAAAMDAATFYATTPEAARHRDAIEAKFGEAYGAGRPIARLDLWQWYKGVNMEHFVQERVKAMEAAAEQAKYAQTVGPGGMSHGGGVPQGKDPFAMSDDELDAFVKNTVF